jgi:chloramphenicol 3-O phosphotransferase
MPRPARIILVNGVSSVGKTSTIAALHEITADPFLHVRMDDFLGMLPVPWFGHPDGITFTPTTDTEGRAGVDVIVGPAGARLFAGMRAAVAAMAAEGNDLILDEVLFEGDADYRRRLAAFDLKLVGLFAPIEVIEARERARGDRMVGLARRQMDLVHQGVTYDLELDTSVNTPQVCAEAIKAAFEL